MHKKAADADRVGRKHNSMCGALKQRAPQAGTLSITSDGEPRKHHDRDRARHIASESSWSSAGRHGAGCQGLVGDDFASITDDDWSRGAAELILQRTSFQPVIQRPHAAIEVLRKVLCGERTRGLNHRMLIRPRPKVALSAWFVEGARWDEAPHRASPGTSSQWQG